MNRSKAQILKEKRSIAVAKGIQQGNPQVSVKMLLSDCDLLKYYPYFRDGGFDMIENNAYRDDVDVEQLLTKVERANKIRFPHRHRCTLYKAFRYRWFYGPTYVRRYIHKKEIPRLVLPKKDHRIRDATIDFKNLEPERQRMVIRKSKNDEREGVRVLQFELYKRQPHMYYELVGLQRVLDEWRIQDPRKMAREDPREEVFFLQIRSLELRFAAIIDKLKYAKHSLILIKAVMLGVRIILGAMAILHLVVAFSKGRSVDDRLFFAVFTSSVQFMTFTIYSMAFAFVSGISRTRRGYRLLQKYRLMHTLCKTMHYDMVTFRLNTQQLRLEQVEKPIDDYDLAGAKGKKLAAIAGVGHLQRKLSNTDERQFDAWFQGVVAAGMPDPLEIQMALDDTRKHFLPDDPGLALLPKNDKFVDRSDIMLERQAPPLATHTRVAVPSAALVAMSGFYDRDKELQQIERLEEDQRQLQWYMEVSDSEEEEEDDDGDEDDDDEADIQEEKKSVEKSDGESGSYSSEGEGSEIYQGDRASSSVGLS